MFNSMWLFWWVFLLFLIAPVGYGWGYRGWGPPYPRYLQRRRAERLQVSKDSVTFNHYSWSWGGDLLWIGFIIVMFWGITSLWWR